MSRGDCAEWSVSADANFGFSCVLDPLESGETQGNPLCGVLMAPLHLF